MRISDCSSDVCSSDLQDLVVVSPDIGGVVRARALAKQLEADLAIIDKCRPRANVSEVMNIIGEVDGRTCIIMDDMVDTAGTLCKAAQALKRSEEHTSELKSLMRISSDVFCLKKTTNIYIPLQHN